MSEIPNGKEEKDKLTCKIKDAQFGTPTIYIPCPAGDGTINQRHPQKCEDHRWENATALSDSANQNCYRDTRAFHLIKCEQQGRNFSGTWGGAIKDVHQTKVLEIAHETIGGSGRERQGVTPEVPLKNTD